MNDKFTINLKIAGSSYPLIINRSDEELIRKAAKLIDVKLANYSERLGADKKKTLQDFLCMTALELSYAYLKIKESRDVDVLSQTIRELDEELERYLKEE
ncbi:cell division protein ZapA [Coprobacter tertius]|uniref:Cell division protein ZapA n=1 Tax=Coprobacter tertius TaxID=2944915 RepID=A0ABT1MLU5_9BACT|nr:cell division protein ZapA [Coprobacter tertius]MCP9612698.1 cell division protein ZapA [Coprobacter tertius]